MSLHSKQLEYDEWTMEHMVDTHKDDRHDQQVTTLSVRVLRPLDSLDVNPFLDHFP